MNEELKTITAGPYTLVARVIDDTYCGALWHAGKKEETLEGTSIDDVWEKLVNELYKRQVLVASARNGAEPTADEAAKAILRIEPRLHAAHKAMLRAHLKSEGCNITATQLATAAGYAGYPAANLHYGLLGAMLFAEMPEELPKGSNGAPIMTCAIASLDDQRSSPEHQWIWKMRPHIVEGLKMAAIL
jgi:hypothetical protein